MAGFNCEIKWATRLCEVDGKRGGHPGGQVGQVYGIVEFPEEVRRVEPYEIHFKDEINDVLRAINEHNERSTNEETSEDEGAGKEAIK